MSDTEIVDPGTQAEQEKAVADLETAAPATKPKPEKVVVPPHACLCQSYRLVGENKDEVYATECGLTTKSTFAQGHDARLVSFLVDGHRDGYQIQQILGDKTVDHGTPADAVRAVSEPLVKKAESATTNMRQRLADKAVKTALREANKLKRKEESDKAKADKAAAKEAAKTEPKQVEVVAGSVTGDVAPLADGQVRIKVGRWEYTATKLADGGVTFTNGKGEVETREEGDGYTVLEG